MKNRPLTLSAAIAMAAAAMTEKITAWSLLAEHGMNHRGKGRGSINWNPAGKSGKTYEPNGKRECARRVRQAQARVVRD